MSKFLTQTSWEDYPELHETAEQALAHAKDQLENRHDAQVAEDDDEVAIYKRTQTVTAEPAGVTFKVNAD